MSLEASITLIYDVYSTGITYDDHHMMIIKCLQYRQQQATGHRPQATGHRPQATDHRP